MMHSPLDSEVSTSSVLPAHIDWIGWVPLANSHHNDITIPLTPQFFEDFVTFNA